MRFETLDRRRKLPPIDELPEPWRSNARNWRSRILANRRRQGKPLRNWEIPIIEGVAKRLGRMTTEELSAQGKRMFHMRGGYAVQRRYRMENRDPLARARHTLKYIRAREKKKRDEAQMLERVGLYAPAPMKLEKLLSIKPPSGNPPKQDRN